MSGPRVAVTGATGFVGWHVIRELRQHHTEPIAVVRASSATSRLQENDFAIRTAALDDVASLATAFEGCDAVVHLAGAVDFAGDWRRFRDVNVQGTANVLEAARIADVRRVVHCSTIAAVGASRTPTKLNESAAWNLGQLRVPYITTKREAEELAIAVNDSRLDVVVVNPGSVIGPDDFDASEFGLMCRRFWRGRLGIHFGGGNCFVDVRDAASGICSAWQRGQPGQRYILGGANRTMSAFFAELANASPQPIPRLRLPSALGPAIAMLERTFSRKKRPRAYLTPAQAKLLPWFFYFDSGKAKRELGFAPRPLQSTVADAFDFWERRRAA
jgi:dihydroflavonol-4-reductase